MERAGADGPSGQERMDQVGRSRWTERAGIDGPSGSGGSLVAQSCLTL